MDVDEVDAVRVQPLERAFGFPGGFVVVPGANLCGEKDFFAAGLHHFAHPGLARAAAVGLRGVEITDTGVDGEVHGLDPLVLRAVGQQSTAASQREARGADAGPPENTGSAERLAGPERRRRRLKRRRCR